MCCLICQNQKYRVFCIKDTIQYLQCLSCRHVFVGKKIITQEVLDKYITRESHHSSKLKEKWDYSEAKFHHYYLPLLKIIDKYKYNKRKKDRLLDMGCSNGSFVTAAKRIGWNAYGVEIEKKSSDVAKKHGVNVYTKILSENFFPDSHFSVITMWDFIEHISHPRKIISETYRILERGGILAISTPNIKSIGWHLLKKRWRAIDPQVHLNLFTTNSLNKIITDCGFKTIRITTLDIKPSTIKDCFLRLKRKEEASSRYISVANLLNNNSSISLKLLLTLRAVLNVPLSICGIGEDIYAFFRKP